MSETSEAALQVPGTTFGNANAACGDETSPNSLEPVLIGMLSHAVPSGLPSSSSCVLEKMIPYPPPRWPGPSESRAGASSFESVLFVEPCFAHSGVGKGKLVGDDGILLSFPLVPVRDVLRQVIASSHILPQEKQRFNAALDDLDALHLAQLITALLARSITNIFEVWQVLKPHLAAVEGKAGTTTPGK